MVKTITITDEKIVKLIEDKNGLVKQGRESSKQLEKIEEKIEANIKKQEEITKEVDCQELFDKGVALQAEINEKMEELNKISEEIRAAKIAGLPQELVDEYKDLNEQKEEEEKQRNKIALKIQKIKDKVAPMIQKIALPQLEDEFEDLSTAVVRKGEVVVTVFSHIEDWKTKFRQKKEAKE